MCDGHGGDDSNAKEGEITAKMISAGIDEFAAYYPDAAADGDAEAAVKAIWAAMNRRSQKMQNSNFDPIAGDGGASLFKLRAGPVIGVHGGSDIAKSVCGAMLGVHVEK